MDEFNLKEEIAVHAEEAQMSYQMLCSVGEYLRWMIDVDEPLEMIMTLRNQLIEEAPFIADEPRLALDIHAAHDYAEKWQHIHFAHNWNAYRF
jgi:hypothetical protein